MKQFLKKFFWIYFLPVFLYFLIVYITDPLKCFRPYTEYYKNNFVPPNRENVCLNLFEQNDSMKYINSFILGNSCSHAYKVNDWIQYLPKGSIGFHLDAYRETSNGVLQKLYYLERKKIQIRNVLIIMDRSFFSKKFDSYLYVMPKKLNEQSNEFYIENFKTLTSIKFFVAYSYYAFFHKNLPFMDAYQFREQPISNKKTGDLNYLADFEIKNDSVRYFKKLSEADWIDRKNVINVNANDAFEGLNAKNKKYLLAIKKVFDQNHTQYKIVINPDYDQKKIRENELKFLQSVFGNNNIFDFSGITKFSEEYKNFYDGTHYRPVVAKEIMNKIYGNNFHNNN